MYLAATGRDTFSIRCKIDTIRAQAKMVETGPLISRRIVDFLMLFMLCSQSEVAYLSSLPFADSAYWRAVNPDPVRRRSNPTGIGIPFQSIWLRNNCCLARNNRLVLVNASQNAVAFGFELDARTTKTTERQAYPLSVNFLSRGPRDAAFINIVSVFWLLPMYRSVDRGAACCVCISRLACCLQLTAFRQWFRFFFGAFVPFCSDVALLFCVE
jgi:hypothetical protein